MSLLLLIIATETAAITILRLRVLPFTRPLIVIVVQYTSINKREVLNLPSCSPPSGHPLRLFI